ncbi:MAG TPA: holo-ACP synthase [Terriglobales bacterium]|nr:holo-ACP synthase [Terriglobales bacterium]
MLVGIGVDLMEHGRMQRELQHGSWLSRDGVFTSREIRRCGSGSHPARLFAACFAAKEATVKALGMPCSDLGLLREIEVLNPAAGPQTIILHRRAKAEAQRLGVARIHATVTPARAFVAAVVILESERSAP